MTDQESTQSSNLLPNAPSYYVGIGASAGGLEAIESFFKNLHVDTGLAFVLVQHLSPDYKSLMAELLSKRTRMPVLRAEEGMLVAKNAVYLIPPKKNLRIFHGRLLLSEQDHSQGLNLPIDVFLRSLAEDQGDKAIGIILSGTGSDGTRGIRAIKEEGGMVMVQAPETAKFDGMPNSAIATGLADFILPPDAMGDQLLSFLKHPYAKPGERSNKLLTDEDGMNRIFALLRERFRIDFTFYKATTVTRRIERRMSINQIEALNNYVRFLEVNRDELATLQRELLIGVTNFFRDPDAFNALSNEHLPNLIRECKGNELRIWIAGCSTGEEAYSLAILCCEAMETAHRNLNIRIFATDVDRDALERASNGQYPESIAADLPTSYLSKYFIRMDDRYQIIRSIREMVVFAQHNVTKDPPFTNIDLISCRNLLIYLQPVMQRKVLEMFAFSLREDGLLFLGSSETVAEMSSFFHLLDSKWKIHRATGRRKSLMISGDPVKTFQARDLNRSLGSTSPYLRSQNEERMLDRLLQGLVGDYLPFLMVINEQLELLHAVGDTRRFLSVPPGKHSSDASKMVPPALTIPLATGVQKVLKHAQDVIFSNITISDNGSSQRVSMRIRRLPEKKGQDPLLAVIIEPMQGPKSVINGSDSQNYDFAKEAEQRIHDLEHELQFVRENLQATIEELETSNEELQATNEELLASNEELQSTNEELQSVNEELFTVNAEYQSKISELVEVNNDLDNLFHSTEVATLFLDENLHLRRFSGAASTLLGLTEDFLGRPLNLLPHERGVLILDHLLGQVAKSGEALEREVILKNDRWYLLRILPYRVAEKVYAGMVVTLVDVDRLKQAEQALRAQQERLKLAQRVGHIGAWAWDLRRGEIELEETVEPMLGFETGELGKAARVVMNRFLDHTHTDDHMILQTAIEACAKGEANLDIEFRAKLPDGRHRWIHMVGERLRDDAGAPRSVVGIVQNLDAIKSAQEELAFSAAQLEAVEKALGKRAVTAQQTPALDGNPVGIGLCEGTRIKWASPGVTSLTGYGLEELLNMDFCSLCTLNDQAPNCDLQISRCRLFTTNSPSQQLMKIRKKDEKFIELQVTTTPFHSGDNAFGIMFAFSQPTIPAISPSE